MRKSWTESFLLKNSSSSLKEYLAPNVLKMWNRQPLLSRKLRLKMTGSRLARPRLAKKELSSTLIMKCKSLTTWMLMITVVPLPKMIRLKTWTISLTWMPKWNRTTISRCKAQQPPLIISSSRKSSKLRTLTRIMMQSRRCASTT